MNLDQELYIYFSLSAIFLSFVLYAIDKWSIIFKSILILSFLLIFFSIFPYIENDKNLLGPSVLLSGFSNVTLITVCLLLILGQGIVQTKALDNYINGLLNFFPGNSGLIFFLSLISIIFLSAFLNNTPVVIIFIPVMQVIALKMGESVSKYLMPLSFAAILGGMTTLIGSSTNLLVANSLSSIKNIEIGFFDFLIPGLVISFFGFIYIFFFSKVLLKRRSPMKKEILGDENIKFIAQITLTKDSPLIGVTSKSGKFDGLEDVSILMIQRKEHAEHGPLFNDFTLKLGDIIIIATTKEALSDLISKKYGEYGSEIAPVLNENTDIIEGDNQQILSEAIISPTSRLVGQTIENISFRYRFGCVVIGLQRQARMIRNSMTEIPLESGDVLLIQGLKQSIKKLKNTGDIMPLEWSSTDIIDNSLSNKAIFIFITVILSSIFEILPLVVSSLIGVLVMFSSNVLTIRQAARAIDKNLLLLIVTSLALGKVILETGTAEFLSNNLVNLLKDQNPVIILSSFFIFVSVLTNFISNNACAVLFTPVAIDFADKLGMDPKVLAISVIFAVNTSFLTPMAYQTNLLVMGPGHYKFTDYLIFGIPLTIICWLTFTLFCPWYFNVI